MRIAIYSPYLDTAGGGEKYILSIGSALSDKNQIDILLDNHLLEVGVDQIKLRNQKFHNSDLSKLNFIPAPLGPLSSNLARIKFLKTYDWVFINSDGSWFFSTAKNSVLHFQLPLTNLNNSIISRLKLKSWQLAIFNSKFTQQIIEKQIKIKGEVVYPPVNIERFKKSFTKKNQILNVGRFVAASQVKKQHVLVEAFKRMVDQFQLKDWSLHLAGGVLSGDGSYLEDLKKLAHGYKVYFYPNINFDELTKLYEESKIYWHAMGYAESDPIKFEHFGITTVEAMAAGCVPVVINKGGQPEIVENEISGLWWDQTDQLIDSTKSLISDSKLLKKMSDQAVKRSQIFSEPEFYKQINQIVYGQ